jgi:hypothetical protein
MNLNPLQDGSVGDEAALVVGGRLDDDHNDLAVRQTEALVVAGLG